MELGIGVDPGDRSRKAIGLNPENINPSIIHECDDSAKVVEVHTRVGGRNR